MVSNLKENLKIASEMCFNHDFNKLVLVLSPYVNPVNPFDQYDFGVIMFCGFLATGTSLVS